jgi:hypothetical protein
LNAGRGPACMIATSVSGLSPCLRKTKRVS